MEKQILVSVVLLSYNHEKYIRKAIDSILAQKVNFLYELIICDDYSQDNTQEIIKEYKEIYPDEIVLLLNNKNLVKGNLLRMFQLCKGKYIATLEGDDFWTDNKKLQKQVEFLEQNRDYISVMHKTMIVNENDKLVSSLLDTCNKRNYKIADYIKYIIPGHASSWVFRNIFKNSEKDYSFLNEPNFATGDRIIPLLLISIGKIYCLPDCMSAYRLVINSTASNWSSQMFQMSNSYLMRYMAINELENLARNNLNLNIKLKKRKKQIFLESIIYWMKNKRNEDGIIVHKIYSMYSNKIDITFFLMYGIPLYYLNVAYKKLIKDRLQT